MSMLILCIYVLSILILCIYIYTLCIWKLCTLYILHTILKVKLIDNNENNDKYNNNRHIPIETISKKLKLPEMNIDYQLKFAH